MDTTINIGEFGGTIAALMIVGAILKNAFPNFPNRLIPLCTWVLGIAAYQTMVGGWSDPKQWLAAVIAAASATGVHSGIKNTMADSKATGVLALFLVCGLSMSVFTGCGTVDGEKQLDPQKVSAVAYSAAAVGTEVALMQHPEWLPQFQLAADDLAALEGNGTLNVDSILAIIGRLPVKELKSENAQLAINGARILIGAAGYSTIEADKLKELQPVVAAIRSGIQEGIASAKNKGL